MRSVVPVAVNRAAECHEAHAVQRFRFIATLSPTDVLGIGVSVSATTFKSHNLALIQFEHHCFPLSL